MKKILLTLIAALLLPAAAMAQMKIVPGSFANSNAGARSATGTDMGQMDMTARSIDWPTDADGKDEVALLRVYFQNFPPAEIKNVTPSLSQGAIVVSKDERVADNGNHFLMVFIPAKKNMDVTFTHPRYGSDRLVGKNFDKHQVYDVTLRNDKTLPVFITSQPEGATILFDGKNVGVTPMTLEDVTLGAHSIEMRSPNMQIADGLTQRTIEITESNASLTYDLRKRINAKFEANPSHATLQLFQNGQPVTAKTAGKIECEIPTGEYIIEGNVGTIKMSKPVSINSSSVFPMTIDVVPTKTITFKANRNNMPVEGAAVNIDGKTYGTTPLDVPLNYGKYNVQMVYSGVSKSGTIKVNDNTNPEYELKLPARQSRAFNPFNTYYRKRAWGLNVAYINKTYKFKVDGHSTSYDTWGQEKSMNGVQMGITYQPYFGYGQGLSTGVYWQGFFGSVDFDGGDKGNYQEHNIYVPLQYQFRLPLGEEFSIALNGGIAMTLGVSNTIKIDTESIDVGFGYNEEYETYMPNSLQWSIPLGVSIQFKAMQLEAKYSIGLTDNKDMYTTDGTADVSFKSSTWSAGISFLF